MSYKIAFTDVVPDDLMVLVRESVPPGFELVCVEKPGEDEIIAKVHNADFILTFAAAITDNVIRNAPKARLIQRWGVGHEKVDVGAAATAGIPVAVTAGVSSATVAEHAIILMLALYKKLTWVHNNMLSGRWVRMQMRLAGHEIQGKVVGVAGFGNIGQAVARRLKAFEVSKILYYDAIARPAAEQELGAERVSLYDLLRLSDIVTVHLPLTDDTHHIISRRELALMKPTALLINAARGGIVDEAALYDALRDRKIAGAGMDVHTHEPPLPDDPIFKLSSDPLLGLDNLVVTPHIGSSTEENQRAVARRCFDNIVRVSQGLPVTPGDGVTS